MGRLLLVCLAAAASGCVDWGSLYDERPDGGGAADARPEVDATPNPLGCSDGSAEVLIATDGLAGCSGAWSIPGVVVETEPACDRAAGNDGRNPGGEGCAVADLCAAGWHVCRDAADVAQHGGDNACERLTPPEPDGEQYIYLTRQRGSAGDVACAPEGGEDRADDAWGCGTLGLETVDCKPLDHHLGLGDEGGGCGEPYDCGAEPEAEGQNITKRVAGGGGVLCCSDQAP